MNKLPLSALVLGANRGLGLETARQVSCRDCDVILSARCLDADLACSKLLQHKIYLDQRIDIATINLEYPKSFQGTFNAFIERRGIDILINNAGVFSGDPRSLDDETIWTLPLDLLRSQLEIHLLGPLELMKVCFPHMTQSQFGRIVNFASGMGRECEWDVNAPYYRLSKAAMIAMTRIAALFI